MIGIIAEGKKRIFGNIDDSLWVAKQRKGGAFRSVGIAAIAVYWGAQGAGHDSDKRGLSGGGCVAEERWGIDAQLVAADSADTFDVKLGRRPGIVHIFVSFDPGCVEHKDVTRCRAHKMVGELVHQNMVAGGGVTARDDVTAVDFPAGDAAFVGKKRVFWDADGVAAGVGLDERVGE